MYQGDTQRHEAQPQEAEVEVKEISAEDKMKNPRATIPENEEGILDLTEKLNLEIKLRSESESNAEVLYLEKEYLKNQVESLTKDLEAETKLRFSALEESDQKEKAAESNFRATIQEMEEGILDLTEKLNLEIKLRSYWESNPEDLSSERECLRDQIESLIDDVDAQTKRRRDSNKAWRARFAALQEESSKKEKAAQSKFRATIQEKEEGILDLTEKLNLELKLRSDREANAEVLSSETKDLEDQMESLLDVLEAQMKQGRDSDMAWQLQLSALKEESDQKEKAAQSNFRATIQEKEEAILNLEIRLRSDRESNAEALYSERERLEDQVISLSKDLEAQTKLGRDSDMAWRSRFSTLQEESSKKEKASESNFRATIQEMEERILDFTEKLNLELKLRSDMESNAEVLSSERECLEDQMESLLDVLEAQMKQGRDKDMAWQSRFSALEEEWSSTEIKLESSTRALITESQFMEQNNQNHSEDLEAQTKLVSDNDKAWKDTICTLKQEHALKEKTMLTAFHTEREDLLQKLKEQSCKMHSMQVIIESLSDHEEEYRRLRCQIVNLEDICFRQKKKNLGCFGRRMGDREVELERMKRKVPARELVFPPPPVCYPSPVDPPVSSGCHS